MTSEPEESGEVDDPTEDAPEDVADDSVGGVGAEEAEGDDSTDEAESVGGVGAVEGEDAVEAQEAAPEVHEAAVESAKRLRK